jgi:subtilisin family serine protease
MCNFVPGEVIIFGKYRHLKHAEEPVSDAKTEYVPLSSPGREADERFGDFGFLRVYAIPTGYELIALSEVSANLAAAIRAREAFVELNYHVPLATESEELQLRLSTRTRRWVSHLNSIGPRSRRTDPVAFIDSGINATQLDRGRRVVAYDYTKGDDPIPLEADHDRRGHGTRVARLLDELLAPEVPLVSAKVADPGKEVTLLSLCRAFGDVVSRERPSVVNLSLAPLDDTVVCRACRKPVPVNAFQSQILARLFRLAAPAITVMAAGNSGQKSNFGRFMDLGAPVVLVGATGSDGAVTKYTNIPPGGELAEEFVTAFGGDDPDLADGEGIFEDRASYGTSFAAPLVTALVQRLDAYYEPKELLDWDARLGRIRSDIRQLTRQRAPNDWYYNDRRFRE